MMSESSRYLRSVLVLTSLLALTQCQYDEETNDQGSSNNSKHYNQAIGRLLFKNMRFRDLPKMAEVYESPASDPWNSDESYTETRPEQGDGRTFLRELRGHKWGFLSKRERQDALVNNLAAVLSDINRHKSSPASLRMPSLRFG